MQAVLLLLLLAGASKGLDSICDVTQDAPCYGALGGPVYLQLMRDTTGYELRFHKEHKTVFILRRSKTVFDEEFNTPSFRQRWQFVPDNGTLIINPAERRDSGTYRVEIYEQSTGKSVGDNTVQLIIEGLDSICDATQDAACYGVLGGPVYLQLMRDPSGHELSFHNEHKPIFRLRRSKTVFYDEFNTPLFHQRWQFVRDNGTLIINPAEKRDAGTYRVQIHEESTGKSVGEHTVQLIIEAPVSVVNLSISCSAYGERRVSCSSNGDGLQYSWSVDGRPLSEISTNQSTESQTKTNKTSPNTQEASPSGSTERPESSPDLDTDLSSSTLTLPEGIQGHLTCSARNNISSASETQLLPSCISVGSICDATQTATCYGALGGPVYLQLMRDTSGHDLSFRNNNETIFRFRASKTTFIKEFNTPSFIQRWQFVPDNGTLIINPAERTDAGTYRVEIHEDSTGKSVGDHTVQLIIEDERKDQEVDLTPTSMSRRRGRTPEEVQMQ